MTISTEAIKSALSALIDPVTGTDYVSGKMFKSAETDENGNVAAYITTGAARPIPQESPARTARCVASEEAMSSPHLPAPKSHHLVGCAREDEAGHASQSNGIWFVSSALSVAKLKSYYAKPPCRLQATMSD